MTLIATLRPVRTGPVPGGAPASQLGAANPGVHRRRDRWLSLAVVLLGTIALTLPLVWGGVRMGQDTATLFYPWYDNLGERLRAGGVPEWNPHQFSGSPLAADPQSGWMYLPAMLFFTLLPLPAAILAQIAGHLLLANLGLYLLARRFGLGQVAALVAGLAFAGSGVFYGRIPSGPASYEVLTCIPYVLLGTEISLQARTGRGRVGGLALAGFAVSQALSAWIGQVSYYTLLLLGALLVYRVLWGRRAETAPGGGWRAALTAPLAVPSDRARLVPAGVGAGLARVIVTGAVIAVIGLGLNAAGLLPRLEFNAVSNLKGGEYTNAVGGQIGGSSSDDVIGRLFQPSIYYPGAAVLVLAVIGVVLGRGRFGVPLWLLTAVVAVVLTVPAETPVHRLFYLLPRFEAFHTHWPERVILVAFPGLAMMAGAGVQVLVEGARAAPSVAWRTVALALPPLVLVALWALGGSVSPIVVGAVAVAVVIAAVALFAPWPDRWDVASGTLAGFRSRPAVLGLALLLVVGADLGLMAQALVPVAPFGGFVRRDVGSYYGPTASSAFLADRMATEGPFRFAGYDPAVGTIEDGLTVLYRYQFPDPITRELIVNNMATVHGLEDVQGYNALRIIGYLDLFDAINGGMPQEYHSAAIYPPGIGSRLLDLLNLRYLIVPSDLGGRPELAALTGSWPTVHDDGTVRILENPNALPRAWLVRQTTTVPAGQALPALARGELDPRQVAVFEPGLGPGPPSLPGPGGPARGTVTPERAANPDRLSFAVAADGPSVLVLSEIAYPAWRAQVDGADVPVLTVDHALRAVAVPAGAHEVVLRYDSPATRAGLAITLATALALIAVWAMAWWRDRRHRPALPTLTGPGSGRRRRASSVLRSGRPPDEAGTSA